MAAGVRLPEHSHCKFCGDPIPFGEEYCDEECRKAEIARAAAEKHKERMFYYSAGAIIVILVVVRILIG